MWGEGPRGGPQSFNEATRLCYLKCIVVKIMNAAVYIVCSAVFPFRIKVLTRGVQ